MEKKVIYLVTSGQYSDYSVHAAFTERADAEVYAKARSAQYDDANVETFELDPPLDKIREGLVPWRVFISVAGEIRGVYHGWDNELGESITPAESSSLLKVATFRTWAKEEQTAIKAANEWRAQMIALGRWEA